MGLLVFSLATARYATRDLALALVLAYQWPTTDVTRTEVIDTFYRDIYRVVY